MGCVGELRDAGKRVSGVGEDGGEEGTDGETVVREAFIQGQRAEKWPAWEMSGERVPGGIASHVSAFCVSPLLHRGAGPELGGSSPGLS